LKDRITQNKDSYNENKHQIEFANQSYELQEKHISKLKLSNEEEIQKYQSEIESNNNKIKELLHESQTVSDNIETLQKQILNKDDIAKKKLLRMILEDTGLS